MRGGGGPRWPRPRSRDSSRLEWRHRLVDRTKHRFPTGIEHFNADAVAITHVFGLGHTVFDGFQHAFLGDTAISSAAIDIGDGSRAHNAATAQIASARNMRNQ